MMKHKYDHTIANGLQIDQLWNKQSPRVKCSDIQKKTSKIKMKKKQVYLKKNVCICSLDLIAQMYHLIFSN